MAGWPSVGSAPWLSPPEVPGWRVVQLLVGLGPGLVKSRSPARWAHEGSGLTGLGGGGGGGLQLVREIPLFPQAVK